jgi:hypothetical protein
MDKATVTARLSPVTGCSALTLGLRGVTVPVTGMLVSHGQASGGVPA